MVCTSSVILVLADEDKLETLSLTSRNLPDCASNSINCSSINCLSLLTLAATFKCSTALSGDSSLS